MMNRIASFGLVLLWTFAANPLRGQNQKDMIAAIQRELALLQEQVKTMQRSQDDRLLLLGDNSRRTSEELVRLNAGIAVTQANINEKLSDVNRQVAGPLTALGSKMESMADQFQSLANTIADVSSRIGKLDAKVVELQKMVQAVQAPVVVPPASTPPAAAGGGSASLGTPNTATGNPAAVPPAQRIFDDAQRDLSAGSYDLALQGFQDFVKNYGTAQMAADAQFYIGEIYSRREDFENAIKEYDKVIQDYADSSRVSNARFMKGIACMKLGRRTLAKKEFQTVVDKYPGNELATRSKEYLRALGVTTTQAPPPVTKKATVRRR